MDAGVDRYFYSSSACVYPDYRQDSPEVPALREAELLKAVEGHWPVYPQTIQSLARTIDKMPANFAHVGMIQRILPGAKIVDVRRHPPASEPCSAPSPPGNAASPWSRSPLHRL